MRWTSSSNTFSNLGRNSLAFLRSLFDHQSAQNVKEKVFFFILTWLLAWQSFSSFQQKPHSRCANWCRTITAICAICALYSKAKFMACQNISLGNLASHEIFSLHKKYPCSQFVQQIFRTRLRPVCLSVPPLATESQTATTVMLS